MTELKLVSRQKVLTFASGELVVDRVRCGVVGSRVLTVAFHHRLDVVYKLTHVLGLHRILDGTSRHPRAENAHSQRVVQTDSLVGPVDSLHQPSGTEVRHRAGHTPPTGVHATHDRLVEMKDRLLVELHVAVHRYRFQDRHRGRLDVDSGTALDVFALLLRDLPVDDLLLGMAVERQLDLERAVAVQLHLGDVSVLAVFAHEVAVVSAHPA